MPATPQSLVNDSLIQTGYGAFGNPMSIAEAAAMIEKQKANESAAQIQAMLPSLIAQMKSGNIPKEQALGVLSSLVGTKDAVALVKQLYPEPVGNYGFNQKTGKYELLPGLPDPVEQLARKSQAQMDIFNQQSDIRQRHKDISDARKLIAKNKADRKVMRGYDNESAMIQDVLGQYGLEPEDIGMASEGIPASRLDASISSGKAFAAKPTGDKRPLYLVGNKKYSAADVEETAQKHGISEDEVLRRIGVK